MGGKPPALVRFSGSWGGVLRIAYDPHAGAKAVTEAVLAALPENFLSKDEAETLRSEIYSSLEG